MGCLNASRNRNFMSPKAFLPETQICLSVASVLRDCPCPLKLYRTSLVFLSYHRFHIFEDSFSLQLLETYHHFYVSGFGRPFLWLSFSGSARDFQFQLRIQWLDWDIAFFMWLDHLLLAHIHLALCSTAQFWGRREERACDCFSLLSIPAEPLY